MRLAYVDSRLRRWQFGTVFSVDGGYVAMAGVLSTIGDSGATSAVGLPDKNPQGRTGEPLWRAAQRDVLGAMHFMPRVAEVALGEAAYRVRRASRACGERGARHDALRVVATPRGSGCVAASEGGRPVVLRNQRPWPRRAAVPIGTGGFLVHLDSRQCRDDCLAVVADADERWPRCAGPAMATCAAACRGRRCLFWLARHRARVRPHVAHAALGRLRDEAGVV